MLKNYFITAIRNISRQKGFAFINVMGLAIGLASAMLIFLYIFDELSFDTIHPDAANTYRLGYTRVSEDGNEFTLAGVPAAWATQLEAQYPEVEASLRYLWFGYPASVHYKEGDKILLTEKLFWTDSSFPKVLYCPMVEGSQHAAFDAPNAMALSQSTAKRLFGTVDPIGKTVVITHPATRGQELNAIITGVFKDFPTNSHLQADYLVNMEILRPVFGEQYDPFLTNWANGFCSAYIRTSPDADMEKLTAGLNQMLASNIGEQAPNYKPFFKNVTDLHFDSEVQWVNEGAGDLNYIYVFGSIAFLILLIASINYTNLATARSGKRAKEIGLRKTLGGLRKQLMAQFLGESLLTTVAALILAIIIMMISLPFFNQLAQKAFSLSSLFSPVLLAIFIGVTLFVAILSGLYPALYLSGFQPIDVLRGQFASGKGTDLFRKTLVVAQFSISLILLICTGIILYQMNFLKDSKLSTKGSQVISIRYGGTAPSEKYPTFKNLVLQDPDIQAVTMANHLPRQEYFGSITNVFRFPGVNENDHEWSLLNVDPNFGEAFDLEVIAGRDFDPKMVVDSSSLLMNEAAVRNLGLSPEEALGMAVLDPDANISGQVIGVVKDFPYRSMRQTIEPLILTTIPNPIDKIVYVELPSNQISEKIAMLEEKWKEVNSGIGFDYWFISDEFERMYVSEERMADLTRVFSILAIIIACLGVFGLASYIAERRNKEIGIRKILGASVGNILILLSKTFIGMLIIASVIAIPLAYLLMNDWLQTFVYHVDLAWWIFAGALFGVYLITILTVGYETLKAAMLDPVEFIREE